MSKIKKFNKKLNALCKDYGINCVAIAFIENKKKNTKSFVLKTKNTSVDNLADGVDLLIEEVKTSANLKRKEESDKIYEDQMRNFKYGK